MYLFFLISNGDHFLLFTVLGLKTMQGKFTTFKPEETLNDLTQELHIHPDLKFANSFKEEPKIVASI